LYGRFVHIDDLVVVGARVRGQRLATND
jgi:hypothetical protein